MVATLDSVLEALKAIAEPTRLRILALCRHCELTVNEICDILGQSQPRISRHLKLLVHADILEKTPEGNSVFHRMAQSTNGDMIASQIAQLLPQDDGVLLQDQARLELIKQNRSQNAARYFEKNANRWNELRAMHIDEVEVEKTITSLIPPHQAGDFLDIGTGTGRMLELYGPHANRSEGIDLSRHMLAIAREALEKSGIHNCRVRQGDMYQLPYNKASFDTIMFYQVLHFAEDPARAISEAARTLRPGGKIMIVDFAPHSVESLRKEHTHRRLGFPQREIENWFETANLTPLSTIHLPGDPLTVSIWLAQDNNNNTAIETRGP